LDYIACTVVSKTTEKDYNYSMATIIKPDKKSVLEATGYLSEANILVVLPAEGNMVCEMPYDPDDDQNTIPLQFHHWLLKEENNVDAIQKTGQLFTYVKESGSNAKTALLPGPIAI
jgi:hypothetical protein